MFLTRAGSRFQSTAPCTCCAGRKKREKICRNGTLTATPMLSPLNLALALKLGGTLEPSCRSSWCLGLTPPPEMSPAAGVENHCEEFPPQYISLPDPASVAASGPACAFTELSGLRLRQKPRAQLSQSAISESICHF